MSTGSPVIFRHLETNLYQQYFIEKPPPPTAAYSSNFATITVHAPVESVSPSVRRQGTPHRRIILETPYYTAYVVPEQANRVLVEPKLDEVATDAVQGRFPLLGRKINDEGILQEYEVAGEKSQEFWRKALGRRLVKDVVQGDISAAGVEWTVSSGNAFLLQFPQGYELFVHKKGDLHVPREDRYLFGSRYASVFRSPNEFAAHLAWLMKGQPMKDNGTRDCICKYCDGKTQKQREINKLLPPLSPPPPATEIRDASKSRNRKRQPKQGSEQGVQRHRHASPPIPFKDYTQLFMQTGEASSPSGDTL